MTTIWQQQTIAGGSGNWAGSVPFDQFDPSGGIFLDAIMTTSGTLGVSASIENLAPVAATVNIGVAATIVASAPFIGNVGSVSPSVTGSVNLGAFQGAFDGALDFGGPSGTVLPDMAASQTQFALVTPGSATASPFQGAGTFDVAVSSYATSTVTGNGNLAVVLHGTTSADLSLQYDVITPKDSGYYNASVWQNYAAAGNTTFMMALSIFQIVNFVTTTPQVVTLPSQTTGWTGAASFNQFDPSLGTLVEIRRQRRRRHVRGRKSGIGPGIGRHDRVREHERLDAGIRRDREGLELRQCGSVRVRWGRGFRRPLGTVGYDRRLRRKRLVRRNVFVHVRLRGPGGIHRHRRHRSPGQHVGCFERDRPVESFL